MFTGIIQEIGTVARVERARGLVRLMIHAPKTASRVQRLESVAVNGVCLSVVDLRRETLLFEVIPETQRLTTLGRLRRADRAHLEMSLSLADRLNGHLLLGHVDGVGRVVKRRQLSGELVLEIRLEQRLHRLLTPKGPVAIDGISLTVGRTLGAATFTIHLIPETMRHTTLGARRVGDHANIELDYIAKLIRQFTARR